MKRTPKGLSSGYFTASSVFILVVASLASCTGEKDTRITEQDQQIQSLQSEVDQLQKKLTEKEDAISKLNEEKAAVEDRIPNATVVEKGDNHWTLAYKYLTEKKGVPAEKAKRMLANAFLFDPILEGYRIWNYDVDGEAYGGFLTQNEASVSPGSLERTEKKHMEEEQAALENRIAELDEERRMTQLKLDSQVREMDELRQQAEERRKTLQSYIESLEGQMESLRGRYAEMDSRLNSVYYLAGSKDELEKMGKIEGSLFGGVAMGNVQSSDFQQRADLRQTQDIELEAKQLDVSRISKVELLPETFVAGRDYRVEIADGEGSANVHLLNEEKFRLATIILSVQ